ncbi:hypothetical protein BYT27DRAFT_7259078 [Phlegmacium glaucopus]|nr:hypothetical protein BYT27DRAFT_7259078 [Phlegmacium glaucopus]
MSSALSECKKKLANTQRRNRHLVKQKENLKEANSILKNEASSCKKKIVTLEYLKVSAMNSNNDTQKVLQLEREEHREALRAATDRLALLQREIRQLKKQIDRGKVKREQMAKRARRTSKPGFKLMQGGSYSVEARKLSRLMVQSGCARSKVGMLIRSIGELFNVKIKRIMGPRTVGRTMIEGFVAAKAQIGYEISQSRGVTLSADGTGNKGEDFESVHIATRTADYRDGLTVDQNSVPKIRLLAVDSMVEHTAKASVENIINHISEATDLFSQSPHAARLKVQLTIQDFFRILNGMNGDHASKEKSAARGMHEKKQMAALEDLGEETLLSWTPAHLMLYLSEWNRKKIADAGGPEKWNSLTQQEQATCDAKLMSDLVQSLGKDAYDKLSVEDRRKIDLFIWAGCCMHKNGNSFEAGSKEMIQEWDKLGLPGPMLLANKFNAAALHRVLSPGGAGGEVWTEDERQAFEQSTRGGVKATALAGTILNNKLDKRGEGTKHINYFKEKVDKNYTHFPDTTCDLIKYLPHYITYFDILRLSKQSATFNHLELNVSRVLKDEAAITELCAMVLYQNAVSKPYMCAVRRPGKKAPNALDLGPLHKLILEFISKVIETPEILVALDASHIEGSLDGKGWDDPGAMAAALVLIPELPCITAITIAFFRGSLPTWTRFSAEFAPGGLIDEATAEEKHLSWMPATNDTNEGALGAHRVTIQNKPSMTLHQYNALAMFRHNDTQEFMDAVYVEADHKFIMREACRIDASGLEGKRRKQLVDFRVKVAQIRKGKEDARKQKVVEDAEQLSKVILITKVEDISDAAWNLTVAKLGEQIDAFRFCGLPNVPVKSRFPKKAERQEALKEIFLRYQQHIIERGSLPTPTVNLSSHETRAVSGWEVDEDEEMEE